MADNEIESTSLTRRMFCMQACGAMSIATIGSILSGCGGSPTSPSSSVPSLPTINASVSNGVASITIDAASPLAAIGSAAFVQTTNGAFLVVRTAQSSFTVLTAVCTHEGCAVTGFQNQTFECPCHGSQYNTTGAVVRGPATRALRQFASQFDNGVLAINT